MKTEAFENARQFLEALNPIRSTWLPDGAYGSPWLFRGQREAEWELTPTLWRPGPVQELLGPMRTQLESCYENEVRAGWFLGDLDADRARSHALDIAVELEVIWWFVEFSNRLGFRVPGGRPLNGRDYLAGQFKRSWPSATPFVAHDSTALAQHHGIPTRLLDWTRDPYVAAFFAAESVRAGSIGSLAVWACHPSTGDKRPIQTLFCRHHANDYLHAQDATFLFHGDADSHYLEHGAWPSLKESISDSNLRKLVLPHSEAPELLRLLGAKRITRAHLMPTFDNVAQTLLLRWRNMTAPG